MNISIFGIGYVGAVTAGCLAAAGHRVIGVDPQPPKVEALKKGLSPILEPGLPELLAAAHTQGLLDATTDVREALAASDAALVCVGTPPDESWRIDLRQVHHVAEQVAEVLTAQPREKMFTLVFRSTMLPGSTREICARYFEELIAAGKLEVYFYPEFLREGSAVRDFQNPSLAVVGSRDETCSGAAQALFAVREDRIVSYEAAEMVKYSCNAFHAAKVVFGNEVGRMAKAVGVDGRLVMEMLCDDTVLNISPRYLRPGTPFGGSCLPKDVGALEAHAAETGVALPMVSALRTSNQVHLEHIISLIERHKPKSVAIIGIAFKKDTDDLRGSAMLQLAAHLHAQSTDVRLFDPSIDASRLLGANAAYVEKILPELFDLLHPSLADALSSVDVIVAATQCVGFDKIVAAVQGAPQVIDIAGWPALTALPGAYEGICW